MAPPLTAPPGPQPAAGFPDAVEELGEELVALRGRVCDRPELREVFFEQPLRPSQSVPDVRGHRSAIGVVEVRVALRGLKLTERAWGSRQGFSHGANQRCAAVPRRMVAVA
jgi:hypothetical protein